MLELYYNFFTRFCDVNKFEELEMDTGLLYLSLAEKHLEDCMRPEKRNEWQRLRSNDCVDNFTADAAANSFPRFCCVKDKQHAKREPGGLFKEEFRCTEMLCLCRNIYCCYNSPLMILNLAAEVSKNAYWNRAATDHWKKNRRVLNEKVNVTSNNRRFRTNNHSVASYEQVKKCLSFFCPKRIVKTDGIHTQPLNL